MEKALKNVLDGLTRVNVGVAPSLGDTLYRELDNELSNLPGGLVEQDSKVVFGEERVGGVRGIGVVPDLELVVGVGVENSLRRLGKRLSGSAEEGFDIGLNGGHDENGHRVANLLSEGAETGNSVDRVLNALHDLVTEAEDLPENLVKLLGAHGARVGSGGAEVLEVVHLAAEVVRVLTRHLDEHLSETGGRRALAVLNAARVGERLGKVGNGSRREVVTRLTHERVDEVGTTKGAGDQRVDVPALRGANTAVLADVGEDLLVA